MNKVYKLQISLLIFAALSLSMTGCSKDNDGAPKAGKSEPAAPAPSQQSQPAESTQKNQPTTIPPQVETRLPAEPSTPDTGKESEQEAPDTTTEPETKNTDMLALAKTSGCMACHSVDRKMVGPAWKDVAARYKGEADARAKLIEKVSKGGKGNWTDITGGIAMPPYYPRVSSENIERLVDFVLSLSDN